LVTQWAVRRDDRRLLALAVPARARFARFCCWAGLLLAFLYFTPRSIDEVGGVGALELVRGGGPAVMLVLSLVVEPRSVRKLKFGLPELAILAFVAIALMSTIWSFSPQATVLKSIPLIFTYLCCLRIVRMAPTSGVVLDDLVLASHLVLIAGLIEWVLFPSLAYSGVAADPTPRFQTIVPGIASNLLGLVAAVGLGGLVLGFGPAAMSRGLPRVGLFVGYITILIAGRSRIVSVLALVILILVGLFAMHRSRLGASVGWMVIAGALTTCWIALQSSRVVDALTAFALRGQDARNLDTLTGRTVIWDYAVQAWREQPWLGFGYYSGHRLALPNRFAIFANYSNIDNTWLEVLVDVGLVGLIALAIGVVAGTLRAVASTETWEERIFIGGLLLAIVVLSFVNPGVQTPSSTAVIFAVLVFTSSRVRKAGAESVSARSSALLAVD
jgi:O-antigen ligase